MKRSSVSQQKQTQSRLDNNALKHAFLNFVASFETQVDSYFKNYNRFIQENKSKMEVYVKATKKEKEN